METAPTTTRRRRRALAGVGAVLALTASGLAGATTIAQAAPGPTDVVRTFAATPGTLGAIPDEPATGVLPKVVEIPVSGVTTAVTDVRLSIGLQHAFSGDLDVVLVSPTGSTALLVLGDEDTDGSDYNGTYTFFDGALGNLVAAAVAADSTTAIPTGSYAPTSAVGGQPVSMTDELKAADANGTWRVRVTDRSSSDTGTVTSATLTLATQARSETAGCKTATAAAAAAQSAVAPASTALAQAQKKLKKAKKSSAQKQTRATKVKKAEKRVKTAAAALAAANATATSAAAARTTAC